jgi:hypothetical protein
LGWLVSWLPHSCGLARSSVRAWEVAALQSRAAAGRLRVALFPTAVSSANAVPAGLSAVWSCSCAGSAWKGAGSRDRVGWSGRGSFGVLGISWRRVCRLALGGRCLSWGERAAPQPPRPTVSASDLRCALRGAASDGLVQVPGRPYRNPRFRGTNVWAVGSVMAPSPSPPKGSEPPQNCFAALAVGRT